MGPMEGIRTRLPIIQQHRGRIASLAGPKVSWIVFAKSVLVSSVWFLPAERDTTGICMLGYLEGWSRDVYINGL